MTDPPIPTIADVHEAADRIAPYIHRTPIVTSRTINRELGLQALFKCENLQKVGAFKARGALNAVLSLSDSEARRGVVTHSSGNHGQALAYAAGVRDIECTVVMPDGTSRIKLDAVKAYGGRVVLGPRAAREEIAAREQQALGAVMIHPYEHPDVIAGQGTATLELVEDHPDLDAAIAPVGGGALLSGAAIVLATVTPHARVIGAEPASADAAYQSLQKGRLLPASGRYDSIAEGLLAGLGRTAFAVLSAAGAVVQRVTEHEIIAAARFHLERMKLVVEPSGAAALAALRLQAGDLEGSRVGVIVSGGNTDFSWLAH